MTTQEEVNEGLIRVLDRLLTLVERDYAELRQGLADLDDVTVKRRQHEELHSRVDAIERMRDR